MACLLSVSMLSASNTNETTIKTDKIKYTISDTIFITVTNMLGGSKDWIAIYPEGSSSDSESLLFWDWTNSEINTSKIFKPLPVGKYEVRAFFNNTFHVEAMNTFTVEDSDEKTNIIVAKRDYFDNEPIEVKFENMLGNNKDWIAIYAKGSNSEKNNVIAWKFTEGENEGVITFEPLPVGEYEARAFFKNSYKLEAQYTFSVKKSNVVKASLQTSKSEYNDSEKIIISFKDMLGDKRDWIALYPKGSSLNSKNIIEWKYTDGLKDGTITFNKLPKGEYQVRAFFNDSYILKADKEFIVRGENTSFTLYEDAEESISDKWIHHKGDFAPIHVTTGGFKSKGALALATEWTNNGTINLAEYYLPLHNTTQKILEMDIGGLANYSLPNKGADQMGYMSHYGIGVTIHTKKGKRKMVWDSFLNHGNVEPYTQNNGKDNVWMFFPSPVEHVRGYLNIDVAQWDHFRVDIESELQRLEPDNKVISIDFLLLTGGFIDNIKLSSK